MLPQVSTKAITLLPQRFSAKRWDNKHAVMGLEQAEWHGARAPKTPGNVTPVPLPPYAPELNPLKRAWLYPRKRFPSHRLLDDNTTIVNACCAT